MLIFYKKYYPGAGWLMRILIRLAVLLKACWATISAPLRKKPKAVKHRRLLILCREDHFEEVKAVCLKAMPDLEFVNLWDLDACDGCYLSQEPDERLYGLRFSASDASLL